MSLKLLASGVAVALFGLASASSAAIMQATYVGSIVSGTDDTNFFHDNYGADLAGAQFLARFRYDTSLGQVTTSPGYDGRTGGAGFGGGVSPILGAWLTINGVTDTLPTFGDGAINVMNQAGWEQTFAYVNEFDSSASGSQWSWLQLFVNAAPDPVTLTTPFTGGNIPEGAPAQVQNEGFSSIYDSGGLVKHYDIAFAPTQVTLSAVPEPGEWALLVLGLSGVGAALRRRRSAALGAGQ